MLHNLFQLSIWIKCTGTNVLYATNICKLPIIYLQIYIYFLTVSLVFKDIIRYKTNFIYRNKLIEAQVTCFQLNVSWSETIFVYCLKIWRLSIKAKCLTLQMAYVEVHSLLHNLFIAMQHQVQIKFLRRAFISYIFICLTF